jgi:hypothetical protein
MGTQSLSKNYHFLFLSCPKSVIGYPEGFEKNRFRLIDSSIRRGERTAGMTDR